MSCRQTISLKSGRPLSCSRTIGLVLLMAALLLVQALGQIHAVRHGLAADVMHGAGSGTASAPHVAYAGHAHDGAGFLDQLFSSHASDADCRLYDQLAGGQIVPSALAMTLPVAAPPFAVASFAGDALARWAALFDARGPPLPV